MVNLERWAAEVFRSVNAHIEYLLREAARKAGRINSQANTETDSE
ncbi:MAG: type II toxin-antitoxin system antitoxin [Desulfitobacteriaceae bacterium]